MRAVTRHRDSRKRPGPHTHSVSCQDAHVAQRGVLAIDSTMSAIQVYLEGAW